MGFAVGIREIDVDGFHSCASGLQRFDLVGVIFHYGRVFTGKFHEWKPEVIDIVALSPFQHLKRTIVEKGFPYIRVGNFLIDSLYIGETPRCHVGIKIRGFEFAFKCPYRKIVV